MLGAARLAWIEGNSGGSSLNTTRCDQAADYIIRHLAEGGDGGGQVVRHCTPEQVQR